jgi:hypothetical protein
MSRFETMLRECWQMGPVQQARVLTRFVARLEFQQAKTDSISLVEAEDHLGFAIAEVKAKEVQLEPA